MAEAIEAQVVQLHSQGYSVRRIAIRLRIGRGRVEQVVSRHLERHESARRSTVFRRSVEELVDQALSAQWAADRVERGRRWPYRPAHAEDRGPTGLPLEAVLR